MQLTAQPSQNTALSADKGRDDIPAIISDAEFAVLERIVQGRTLEEAGADSAFLLRVMQNPTLALAFKLSREVSAFALEEEAISRLRAAAAHGAKLAPGQMTAITRLVEQLRWSAEKRHPNVFSTKAALSLTVPIQINTSLDMGEGTTASAPGFPNIYELKAEVVRDADGVSEESIRELGGLGPPEASVVGTPATRAAEEGQPEPDRAIGGRSPRAAAGVPLQPDRAETAGESPRPGRGGRKTANVESRRKRKTNGGGTAPAVEGTASTIHPPSRTEATANIPQQYGECPPLPCPPPGTGIECARPTAEGRAA